MHDSDKLEKEKERKAKSSVAKMLRRPVATRNDTVSTGLVKSKRKRQPKGELADRKHIISELRPIIRKLKHFPSEKELKNLRRSDIVYFITEYHGGFVNFQISLGFKPRIKTGSLSLYREENFLKELEEFRKRLGHFPTKRDFFREDKIDLYSAARHYGGLDTLRKERGIKPIQLRGQNSLRVFDNYSREIGAIWKRLGHFPSWGELEALKRFDILGAARYHGGITGTRKRLGAGQLIRTKEDSFRNKEVFDRELAKYLKSKGGVLPTWKQISKEYGELARAISNNVGMNKLRESLGMKLILKSGPYSRTISSNFFKDFDRICATIGHFPSDDEIRKYNIYPYIGKFGGLSKLKIRYCNDQIEDLLLHGYSTREIARRLGLMKKLVEDKKDALFSSKGLISVIDIMHQNKVNIPRIARNIGLTEKGTFLDARKSKEGSFDLLFALYEPLITKIATRYVENSSTSDKVDYVATALFEVVKRRKELPRRNELIKLLNTKINNRAKEEATSRISLDNQIDESGNRFIDFVDTESKLHLGRLRRK